MERVLLGEVGPLALPWPEIEGALRTVRSTAMQMVEAGPASAKARLGAGEIVCVDCGDELRPWVWDSIITSSTPDRVVPARFQGL